MYKKFDLEKAIGGHNNNGIKIMEPSDSLEKRSLSQNTFEPGKAMTGQFLTPKLMNVDSKRANKIASSPGKRAQSVASKKSFYDDLLEEYQEHNDFLEQKTKEDKWL